ncbi:tail fiber protein [Abyssalbus ytuae]|uniref:Tail fiber protein n=1 Tax=Abyssalbus ytuae TaxID=2926907 RepID=A0A9E6ZND5_9FLAO|nr:tail fiber protein [Abyssalbus ytuae]UOB17884.1 tail fiber protein [Abyssalbus ytuae]
MKKLFVFTGLLCFFLNANAQNIFPDNGNVGIGTTDPQEKLQIGNAYTFHDGGHKVIGFLYKPSGGVDLSETQFSGEIRFDPVNGKFFIGTSNTITSNPVARITIDNSGNIGIGTKTPNATLQIGESNNSGSPDSEIEIKRLSLAPITHSGSDWFFTTRDNNPYANLDIGYGNNKTLTLRHDGNVGIGTTTPDSKLTVAGNIHSREVKVTVNAGADFVFDKDYNLPTLEKVQEFIQQNGHLPEIPSALDMEQNGIHLSEMNIKLLQKIEELTLYVIDLNKKNEQHQNFIEAQSEVIKALKKEITELKK